MEAVEKLADEAGMTLPKATPESQEQYDASASMRLQGAAAFCEACLRAPEGVRPPISGKSRPDRSLEPVPAGLFADDWRQTIEHLKGKGFSMSEIVEAGLAVEKDGGEPYDRFRGRLMFPIEDRVAKSLPLGDALCSPTQTEIPQLLRYTALPQIAGALSL